jgi:hypothetical protein
VNGKSQEKNIGNRMLLNVQHVLTGDKSMKKLTTILTVLVLSTFLMAGSAMAVGFSFSGNYSIENLVADSDPQFFETLIFDSVFTDGSGAISEFDPNPDGLISVGDYVELPNLIFDKNSYVSGEYYDFSPTVYTQAFKVFNSGSPNVLLFSADLTVSQLIISGTTGAINPFFTMNLSNINAGSSYTLGTSTIVDSFLNAPGGKTQITLQFGDKPLPDKGGAKGTYSGTASPVPEPATMMLLGTGIFGLALFGRRKFKK